MIIPVPITDEKETIAMKKRLLALFIAILAALPLTACGNGQTAETTADTAAAETETAVETEPSFDPMLEAVDYGGEDFVILYNYGNDLEPNKDFVGDTLTGEIVNDAIYNRTISLEDKYNVKMVYTMLKGDGEVGSAIQKAVTAGDSTYAAADINAQFCIQQASKGNLMELRRLPDTELEVLKALWDTEPPASRAQLEELLSERGWASNTVNTYLTRLLEKGYLSCEKRGKSNFYTPLVTREEYQSFDSRAVLHRLYGSPRNFVAALARKGLDQRELEELRALLDELDGGT